MGVLCLGPLHPVTCTALKLTYIAQGTLDADLKDPLLIARLIEDAVDGAVVVARRNQLLQQMPGQEHHERRRNELQLKSAHSGIAKYKSHNRRVYGILRFSLFTYISVQVGYLKVNSQNRDLGRMV